MADGGSSSFGEEPDPLSTLLQSIVPLASLTPLITNPNIVIELLRMHKMKKTQWKAVVAAIVAFLTPVVSELSDDHSPLTWRTVVTAVVAAVVAHQGVFWAVDKPKMVKS